MDERDRQKIKNNLERLQSKTRRFDDVVNELVREGILNEYMKNEILTHPKEDRVRFFYEYVTTRGPHAFKRLVVVLNRTDNQYLASFLDEGRVMQNGYGSNELSLDEEFPLDPNIKWNVRKGEDKFDLNQEYVYKMRSKPKGLMLIVNIRKFVNDTKEERFGSEHDVMRLRDTFEQVGYDVTVKEGDLTADDIKKAVQTFAKRNGHWGCDSCVVVVMSHGTYHPTTINTINFYGWDLTTVNSEYIIQQFKGNKCKALLGKPKLFFFQACRGEELNYTVKTVSESERQSYLEKIEQKKGDENEDATFIINNCTASLRNLKIETATRESSTEIFPLSESYDISENQFTNGNEHGSQVMTDSGLVNPPGPDPFVNGDRISVEADLFIGHSTTPGNVSRRDPETGSWFIQILCQMIAKHAWNKDISTILEHVKAHLSKIQPSIKYYDSKRGIGKKIYFQPGIYDDDEICKEQRTTKDSNS